MKKLIALAALLLLILPGAAFAFDAPDKYEENQLPNMYDYAVQFGLINGDGTTASAPLGDIYGSFFCEFTRIGTGTVTVHLQGSKYNLSFVNMTDPSGQSIDTNTENLAFGIAQRAGHKASRLKLKVSGANFANALTNSVCGAGAER